MDIVAAVARQGPRVVAVGYRSFPCAVAAVAVHKVAGRLGGPKLVIGSGVLRCFIVELPHGHAGCP